MAKCKIRVTETSKRIIPLADVERVNEMLRKLREDEMEQAIPDYLHIVMDCIKPYSGNWEYYNIRAEVCKNRRVDWNYYTENTWTVDNSNFRDPLIITKTYLVSELTGKKIPNSTVYSVEEFEGENLDCFKTLKEARAYARSL